MIAAKWIDSEEDLAKVHGIRRKVFIEEQGVSEEEEMDGTDEGALHLLVCEGTESLATGRLRIENGRHTLGRIAVLKEHRGRQLGDLVVRMLIRKAFEDGGAIQYLHAQTQAQGFYEKLGFTAYGEEYEEACIPHISMKREGDIEGHC